MSDWCPIADLSDPLSASALVELLSVRPYEEVLFLEQYHRNRTPSSVRLVSDPDLSCVRTEMPFMPRLKTEK
jgi:hypothetical protein